MSEGHECKTLCNQLLAMYLGPLIIYRKPGTKKKLFIVRKILLQKPKSDRKTSTHPLFLRKLLLPNSSVASPKKLGWTKKIFSNTPFTLSEIFSYFWKFLEKQLSSKESLRRPFFLDGNQIFQWISGN